MNRWIAACLLAPVLASAQDGFQLPSGNIHCMMWEGAIRCDILQADYARPPRPADCEQEYGDSAELGPTGPARMVCHGDTVADPDNPVLRYGIIWRRKDLTCAAMPTGFRCTNAEGWGFEMARARLRLF